MADDGFRIAVTGHRDLQDEDAVRRAVAGVVAELPRALVCVSALAAGADQLVARVVRDAGGTLEVIVPSAGYEESLPEAARAEFRALRSAASRVVELGIDSPGADAYAEAGRRMLDGADLLVALWDGRASRGSGGTADVVRMARERGIPVRVIPVVRAE